MCHLQKYLYGLKQFSQPWFGRFSSVVQKFGLAQSGADHSQFGRHILPVVYVDDIVITGSDDVGITKLKVHLQLQFQTKDLGFLNFFFFFYDIEVARSKQGISKEVHLRYA